MARDCIFCRIIAGEAPADVVYRDDAVIAFKDIMPRAPVHILVVPLEHVASVDELEERHAPTIWKMFRAAQAVAEKQGIKSTGYRLVINNGPDSGQVIFHLHMHLLGGAPLGPFGAYRRI